MSNEDLWLCVRDGVVEPAYESVVNVLLGNLPTYSLEARVGNRASYHICHTTNAKCRRTVTPVLEHFFEGEELEPSSPSEASETCRVAILTFCDLFLSVARV